MHNTIKKSQKTASLLWEYRTTPVDELPDDLKQWVCSSKARREFFEGLSDDKKIAETVERRNRFDMDHEWAVFRHRLGRSRKRKLIYAVSAAAAVILIPALSFLFIGRTSVKPGYPAAIAEFTGEGISPGRTVARLVVDNAEIEIDGAMKLDTENGVRIFDNEGNNVFSSVTENVIDKNVEEPKDNTLVVPRGGVFSLQMEDGTTVWLNSESELSFPDRFPADSRKVRVKGEAFFDVAPDSRRPFIIETGNVAVRVTGTSFNVRNYADEENTTVAVLEGAVAVENEEGMPYANLSPGLQLVINEKEGAYSLEEADLNKVLAWKNNLFVFVEDDLEAIAKTLERWYDTTINVHESLKGKCYSGTVNKFEHIKAVTDIFRLTGDMEFIRENDGSISIIPPN